MSRDERGRIELLRAIFAPGAGATALVGIGDDAAALATVPEPLVWSIDAAVEGVHFRRDLLGLEDVGYRATMAAASDLAAMGAAPLGVLAALVLPPEVDDDALCAIARGQRAAADDLDTALLGGNLSKGRELSITTTVLGRAPSPLRRDGARVGDVLWAAGPLGLAAAGLALLTRTTPPAQPADADAPGLVAVRSWRRPRARIEEGLRARSAATAAIDVSDGLARDVGHLARASGVLAVIDPSVLVTPELAELAARLGRSAHDLVLHGGEDYALVVSAPPGATLPGFVAMGECRARGDGPSPVATLGADGTTLTAVDEGGFDHFGG